MSHGVLAVSPVEVNCHTSLRTREKFNVTKYQVLLLFFLLDL